MNVVEMYEKEHMKRDIPETPIGSTVKVHYRIIEGEKERIQIFEGNVIQRKGTGVQETVTVRKVSQGVAVERVFPIHSPRIEKIAVRKTGKVRRAKLNFLRGRTGKATRLAERRDYTGKTAQAAPAAAAPVEAPAEAPADAPASEESGESAEA